MSTSGMHRRPFEGRHLVSHWNCRGYSANYEDFRTLLHDYNIQVLMLQETMLGPTTPRAPAGYSVHTGGSNGHRRPGHG